MFNKSIRTTKMKALVKAVLESIQVQDTKSKVTIEGKEYPLAGNISREQLAFIEMYLNEKFSELRKSSPLIPLGRLAMLVCLNLANEIHEQREIFKAKLANYESHIDDIVSTLDTIV